MLKICTENYYSKMNFLLLHFKWRCSKFVLKITIVKWVFYCHILSGDAEHLYWKSIYISPRTDGGTEYIPPIDVAFPILGIHSFRHLPQESSNRSFLSNKSIPLPYRPKPSSSCHFITIDLWMKHSCWETKETFGFPDCEVDSECILQDLHWLEKRRETKEGENP